MTDHLKLCVFCNKEFKKTYSLSRHLQLHTGAKPYECQICGYGFIQKTDLQRHLATHVDELNFTCDVPGCGKMFRTKRSVRSHQTLVHCNSGAFPCPRCGKVFKTSSSLRIHLRKFHDKDYDYRCDYCGRGFPEKRQLHSHFRLVRKNASDVYRVRCINNINREGFEYLRNVAIAVKPVASSAKPLENPSISSLNKQVKDHEFLMSFLPFLRLLNPKSKHNFKISVCKIISDVHKINAK